MGEICTGLKPNGEKCKMPAMQGAGFCVLHVEHPDGDPDHVYIRQAAEILGRRLGTLRKWDQTGVLPEGLRPTRGVRNMRYWTSDQIELMKEWMRDTDRRFGNGLKNWNPTEKDLDQAIDRMRKPHSFKKQRLEEMI